MFWLAPIEGGERRCLPPSSFFIACCPSTRKLHNARLAHIRMIGASVQLLRRDSFGKRA